MLNTWAMLQVYLIKWTAESGQKVSSMPVQPSCTNAW